MSLIKKLTQALINGKISEAEDLANELLMAKSADKIEELRAKKKIKFLGGKRTKKMVCPAGMDKVGNTCVKRGGAKKAERKKSDKKRVLSNLKNKVRSIIKRKRSIDKRKSAGL